MSTRIGLAQDFAVSVGDPGPGHSYFVGGKEPFSYSGDAVLAGRIERRGPAFLAHLVGLCNGTMNTFDGEMKLDRPVSSQAVLGSGAFFSVEFLLSTNSDCSPFLKEQAADHQ